MRIGVATIGVAAVLLGAPHLQADLQSQGPTGPVRVGSDLQAPKKIKDVKPVYPPEAQSARVQGIVILEATIGPDGKVTNARTLRSIPLLDQAALDAVLQWEFTPTLVNGVPVAIVMSVTVNFSLDGVPSAAAPPPAAPPVSAVATSDASPPPPSRSTTADMCQQSSETATQAVRRQAAIRFVEDVNARQRTAFIARQGKGYVTLDQLQGLPATQGFEVQLVADDRGYSVSVKDTIDACAFAFFSDQKGVIYMATPVR
jgi:TonB family protein